MALKQVLWLVVTRCIMNILVKKNYSCKGKQKTECPVPSSDCTVFSISLIYKRKSIHGIISHSSWCKSHCSPWDSCKDTYSPPQFLHCLEDAICYAGKLLFHNSLHNFGTCICLLTPSWIYLRFCGRGYLCPPPPTCLYSGFFSWKCICWSQIFEWICQFHFFDWKPVFTCGCKNCLLTLKKIFFVKNELLFRKCNLSVISCWN